MGGKLMFIECGGINLTVDGDRRAQGIFGGIIHRCQCRHSVVTQTVQISKQGGLGHGSGPRIGNHVGRLHNRIQVSELTARKGWWHPVR